MAVFIKLCRYIDRPVVDDALITIGYARSFADGDGFRLTPFSEVSEGFSNPVWTFVLAFFEKLHFNTIGTSKTLGMWLGALSLPLIAAWGPISQERKLQLEDTIAPGFACTNATFAYWCLGGLEVGQLVFSVALFGVFLFAPRTRRNAIATGLAGAALALTRPEAVLYVGALGLPWLVDWAGRHRFRPSKNDLIFVGCFVAPVALYLVFRRLYFGVWLANTYYAKSSWTYGKTEYLTNAAKVYLSTFRMSNLVLCNVGVVGLGLSMFGGAKNARAALGSALTAAAMFYFAWYAGSDWMKEWRFLAPTLPFLAYPVAAGAGALRTVFQRPFVANRRIVAIGLHLGLAVAVLAALRFSVQQHQKRWKEVKEQGGDVPRLPEERVAYGTDIRAVIADFKMAHPFIGGPDIGYLSLGLRDSEILDLAGLADVSVARHYNNNKALADFMTHEGYPTVLMIWGPSGWVGQLGEVMANYRTSPSGYKVYAKATADTDERCPDGKPAAMSASAEQMITNLGADLDANDPVKALHRWRCYFTYRSNAELPPPSERKKVAYRAEDIAKASARDSKAEVALRHYSLCAVLADDVGCRLKAEKIRSAMFPRKKK